MKITREEFLNLYADGRRDFAGEDMTYLEFEEGDDLSGCSFMWTRMNGSEFTGCNMRDCNFMGANLECTVFEDTDLTGSEFKHAILDGAEFEEDMRMGV